MSVYVCILDFVCVRCVFAWCVHFYVACLHACMGVNDCVCMHVSLWMCMSKCVRLCLCVYRVSI